MSENMLSFIAYLKLITVACYALLYSSGGIKEKWKRRLLGSGLLTAAIAGFSLWTQTFSWHYLWVFPLLYGATSIGYGADEVKEKVFKRSYCGLAYATASLPIAIVNGAWVLLALHIVLCLGISITLGVLNPVHARYEETLLGTTISLLPLFMA